MSSTVSIEYGTHVFLCICNAGQMSGVVVNGESNYLADDFQDAITWAIEMFPYVDAEAEIDEYGGYWLRGESSINWESVKLVEDAIEQGEIKISLRVEDIIQRLRTGKFTQPKSHVPRKRKGAIYLLEGQKGVYKIGKSVDLTNRAKWFGLKLPFPVTLVHHFESSDYTAAEIELHKRFETKRINGEWFALSDEDVAYIKGL